MGGVAETFISFTIENTPPSAIQEPEIELIEQSGLFFFTCDALFVDLEEHELTTEYHWYVDWNPLSPDEENIALLEPIETGDVLVLSKEEFDNYEIAIEDHIACVVTSQDSEGAVVILSDEIMIENLPDEPPSLGPVVITTNKDYAVGSTLFCEATAQDDEDGILSPQYTWTDTDYNIVSTQQELLLTSEKQSSRTDDVLLCRSDGFCTKYLPSSIWY